MGPIFILLGGLQATACVELEKYVELQIESCVTLAIAELY